MFRFPRKDDLPMFRVPLPKFKKKSRINKAKLNIDLSYNINVKVTKILMKFDMQR